MQNIPTDHTIKEVFIVPVDDYLDIDAFCHQYGSTSYGAVARKIQDFIKENLPTFGLQDEVDKFNTFELTANAFDAYADRGLKYGEQLEITVVLIKKGNELTLKFKDNGKGFANREKGSRFEYKANWFQTHKRSNNHYIGGQGRGLENLNDFITVYGGRLDIKNRKEHGCSIEARFNLNKLKATHAHVVESVKEAIERYKSYK